MNYAIALDYQNCIDCKACEAACKEENGVQLGADKQRIWVGMEEGTIFGKPYANTYPSQCNHCIDAPCVDVCPTDASHYTKGGIVKVTAEECILCEECIYACPYKARFIDDNKETADKCTFCDHRLDDKGTTACQATCPTKVRTFGDLNDPKSEIVQLLKNRGFFVEKEDAGTLPKLFFLLPEDEIFARQSVAEDTKIYTWADIENRYKQASVKRSKDWKV